MKQSLLAATAAIVLAMTPALAQNSGTSGTGTSGTTGAGGTTGTDNTTINQVPNTGGTTTPAPNTTSTTGQNTTGQNTTGTGTNDTTATGQNTTGTSSGTDTTTGQATTGTRSTNTAASGQANPMDPQVIMQQMSQVTKAQDFVTMAAMSDMFEIKSGEAAKDNAKGKMAKQFAEHIDKDHTKSSKELMALAKKEKIDVQQAAQLDERHQRMLDMLNNAQGPGSTTSSTSGASSGTSGGTASGSAASSGNATASNSASGTAGGSGSATTGEGGASSSGDWMNTPNLTFDQMFARQQVQAHQEGIALFKAYAQNGDNEALKQFAKKGLPTLEEHLKMAEKLVDAQNKAKSGDSE